MILRSEAGEYDGKRNEIKNVKTFKLSDSGSSVVFPNEIFELLEWDKYRRSDDAVMDRPRRQFEWGGEGSPPPPSVAETVAWG